MDKTYQVNLTLSDNTSRSLQFTVPQGPEGYTPQKHSDYWTENDINSITNDVVNAMKKYLFGTVEENTLILKGSLPSGTYSFSYVSSSGKTFNIGQLNIA